jgi:hypothetical protein
VSPLPHPYLPVRSTCELRLRALCDHGFMLSVVLLQELTQRMPPEAEEKEKEGGEAGDSPSAVATLSTIATTMTALIGDLRTLLRKR